MDKIEQHTHGNFFVSVSYVYYNSSVGVRSTVVERATYM